MTISNSAPLPKLRNLEATPVIQAGERFILLNDPLRLSEKQIIIPQELAAILQLCDGTRDARGISASLAVRYGQNVPESEIERLFTALDEALLLDNDAAAEAFDELQEEYRSAPYRVPALAGATYPSDESALKAQLDGYLDGIDDQKPIQARGLVSPHIDYERGGPVYAQVWSRVRDAAKEAELAIIYGTDHYGAGNPFTLTRQNYATPYGVLPTAKDIVDDLAEATFREAAFGHELNHRTEHSIELAAIWLHHIREGESLELVPVLCGSLDRFFDAGEDPGSDVVTDRFFEVLLPVIEGKKTLIIAAGDLSHVGPAFGGQPLDLLGKARVKSADDELIALMCEGDYGGFFEAIRAVNDRNNVCGLAPIYLAMRSLTPVKGENVAYDRCPADQQGTSIVSICGVVFH